MGTLFVFQVFGEIAYKQHLIASNLIEGNGIITTSELLSDRSESVEDRWDRDLINLSIKYYPRILYSYNVDGLPYDGNRYGIMEPVSNDKKEILAILEKYPQGKQVIVWYDKKNPNDAVLNKDILFWPVIILSTGLLTLFVMIVKRFLAFSFRNNQ